MIGTGKRWRLIEAGGVLADVGGVGQHGFDLLLAYPEGMHPSMAGLDGGRLHACVPLLPGTTSVTLKVFNMVQARVIHVQFFQFIYIYIFSTTHTDI